MDIINTDKDIEMATEFNKRMDKFLLDFMEEYETQVSIHSILMTQILSMQKASLGVVDMAAKIWMSGGLDVVSKVEETFAKEVAAIRQRNGLVDSKRKVN